MLPLDSSLLGLPRYEIFDRKHRKKGLEFHARYRGPPQECPGCGGTRHWVKDRVVRTVRHENWGTRRVYLVLVVRKLHCLTCSRYFHERFPGLLPWKRWLRALLW